MNGNERRVRNEKLQRAQLRNYQEKARYWNEAERNGEAAGLASELSRIRSEEVSPVWQIETNSTAPVRKARTFGSDPLIYWLDSRVEEICALAGV